MSDDKHTKLVSLQNKEQLNQIDKDMSLLSQEVGYVKKTVNKIEGLLDEMKEARSQENVKVWSEVNRLRDWQIRIGAKIAVWASIGTFLGVILSSLIVWVITN